MALETWVQSQVESYQRLKKMVLDASLLNTQHYKVRIKGKVEQSREGVVHIGLVAIEKGAFGLPSTMVANFTYFLTLITWYIKRQKNIKPWICDTIIYIYIYIYIHTRYQISKSNDYKLNIYIHLWFFFFFFLISVSNKTRLFHKQKVIH